MGRLSEKVAVVTGGATGIGEATCLRFAEEGASVAVLDVSEDGGRGTVEAIRGAGGEAEFFRCDVSAEADVAAAVDAVTARWGRLDILVNNAAVTGVNKLAHEVTVEEWDRVFAVNVRGSFLCTKHAVRPMMANRRGSIVNFSSIYGLVGNDETYPGGLDRYIEMMSARHPLPLGEPVEVADCVLFLASDEARFVTGASLVVDGGYTAQ